METGAGPPSPDEVAAALMQALDLFPTMNGRGWSRRYGGVQAVVTGVPIPTLNGVFVDPAATVDDVAQGLRAVAAAGLPHSVLARPGFDPAVLAAVERAGLQPAPAVPLMATAALRDVAAPDGLELRRLGPDEGGIHCALGAEAFEAPLELFAMLVSPEILGAAPVRAYVGEVAGEAVVTALTVTLGDAVGIFDVATPARFRRRGYGAAVTAHALREGLAAGGLWGWLQSTEAGYGVYQALGFETMERWAVWVTP